MIQPVTTMTCHALRAGPMVYSLRNPERHLPGHVGPTPSPGPVVERPFAVRGGAQGALGHVERRRDESQKAAAHQFGLAPVLRAIREHGGVFIVGADAQPVEIVQERVVPGGHVHLGLFVHREQRQRKYPIPGGLGAPALLDLFKDIQQPAQLALPSDEQARWVLQGDLGASFARRRSGMQ